MDRREAIVILVLVAVTFGAFGRVWTCDFVAYDDPKYVFENDPVREGLTLEGVAWAFTTSHASNWHPLTWISHMLDVTVFGMSPGPMHGVNIVLHVLSAVLLLLALRSLTGDFWASAAVAGLFALHPTRVESVAWISERKDVLSGVFWMLTLWTYAHYAKRRGVGRYALVMASLGLGLLAKPMLVTLPCVLLLLDFWPLRRLRGLDDGQSSGGNAAAPGRLVLEKLPLLALALVSALMTLRVQEGAMAGAEAFSLGARLENALVSYARYLGVLTYPVDLAVLYPYPGGGGWGGMTLLGAVVLLGAITALAVALARRAGYLPVGWLWYLGSLVPVIGLVQVGAQSMADRYTYLPFIGLFIMLAWTGRALVVRFPMVTWPLTAATVAVLALCAAGTWRQTAYWQNSVTLFRHTLAVTEENWRIHNNLGVALAQKGDRRAAALHFTRVMEIRPDDAKSQENLLHAVAEMRRLGETREADLFSAIAEMLVLARDEPTNPDWPFNVAVLFGRLGEHERSIEHFRRAIRLRPDDVEAHLRLGAAYQALGDLDEAMARYRRALGVDPESVAALNTMAWVLATWPDDAVRDGEEAVRLAEKARIITRGETADVLLTLSAAYAEASRFDEAVEAAEAALAIARESNRPGLMERAERMAAAFRRREPWRDDSPVWR